MSINIDDSIPDLLSILTEELEFYEEYALPFILEQATEPSQKDWESAWGVYADQTTLPEGTELYWKAGEVIRGQFGRIRDRVYCIFPARSVSLNGVIHFEFTKFILWEDGQHFLFTGKHINDSGEVIGLFRAYADGSIEEVTYPSFSPDTVLGANNNGSQLWYIEGTSLKRINLLTFSITTATASLVSAPEEVIFDNGADAFFRMDIGLGIRIYRWNGTSSTLSSLKTSILVNGVSEVPGEVLAATQTYVVVKTSQDNYWIQFTRAGGVEVAIKSNPSGSTPANLPAPNASDWVQLLVSLEFDNLSIIYAELTGSPSLGDWKRTLIWDMLSSSYEDQDTLPPLLDYLLDICIASAPIPDPVEYRRDVKNFMQTTVYRSRDGDAWVYNNIIKVSALSSNVRQLAETSDGQIFFLSPGSSGKIWRLSDWDQEGGDAVVLGVIDITGVAGGALITDILPTVNLSERPKGYDLIEVTVQSAVAGGSEAVLNSGWMINPLQDITANEDDGGFGALIGGDGIYADDNSYAATSRGYVRVHSSISLTPQSLAQLLILMPEGDPEMDGAVLLAIDTSATNIVNERVTYQINITYANEPYLPIEHVALKNYAGLSSKGKYMMVRAFRTESRRQGGSYYAPGMA